MKKLKELFIKTKKIALLSIVIVVLIIIGTIFALMPRNSKEDEIKDILKDLGKNFYENTYYDSLVKQYGEDKKNEILSNYQSQGITIDLNNIKRLNKDNEELKKVVNPKTKEECDGENTAVIIYTKSPYGKKDYTIEVKLDCGTNEK